MDAKIILKIRLQQMQANVLHQAFSMYIISSFKSVENKNDVYRDKDCIKKFYRFLRESALKIINPKKKNMKLLTNEQQNSYQN